MSIINKNIAESIFRAYDIRGVVDSEINAESVFLIGKVLGSLVIESGASQMIVARDGRLSGASLMEALTKGILSTGCDVVDVGMVPTPLLYYATNVLDCRSGVMLTGSHNPANYNGLKIVIDGVTLTEAAIKNIHMRILQENYLHGAGSRHEADIVHRYMHFVTHDVRLKSEMKIVIDAGNGIAGAVAPALFRAMNCEVVELHCKVDGRFPNHHPDPSQPENLVDLVQAVKKHHADVGLAFDGDGDRLGVVASNGDIIYPDRLLMYFAKNLLRDKPKSKIMFDVKCTHHLASLIESYGGEAFMWKTGHSLIKKKMSEVHAQLAGEMSGHFFFQDRWYGFDDGLYAAARLLESLSKEHKNSADVFAELPDSISTPELKIPVSENEKFEIMAQLQNNIHFDDAVNILTVDGVRVTFQDGWGLVRASNTTPNLVLRFEADDEAGLLRIEKRFSDWILSIHPDLQLPF